MGSLRTCFFLGLLLVLAGGSIAQHYPPGFKEVGVGNIYYPTSMAVAPDGRIFVAEKAGKIKIIKDGQILSTPFLIINVEQKDERGLDGIAIDPEFANNHFVYIFYTSPISPIHNRVSRFTANGDVAVPGSEVVIIDFEPVVNSIHNGGALAFGSDGKLYIGVGNDLIHPNSQDLSNHKGKVIRINKDGSTPGDNPFTGSVAASHIWVYGLRNPFTVASGMGKIFVNDTGESSWEEINDATTSGKNFGWPAVEGNGTDPAYTNPVYTYPHGDPSNFTGCAISGGTFLDPASSNYPAQFKGKYYFLDYCGEWINYIDPTSGAVTNFASNLSGDAKVAIGTGPGGNLYYFSIVQNILYKIVYDPDGVSDVSEFRGLKVYPNPSNGVFNIVFENGNYYKDVIDFELMDAIGGVISTGNLNLIKTTTSEIAEVQRDLAAGIYFLKLKAGGSAEKIIKLVVSK